MKLTNYLLVLALAGCAATPKYGKQENNSVKLCAQSLVVLKAAANCTALAPICTITLSDLLLVETAASDKQNYCPRLREGQEAANQ